MVTFVFHKCHIYSICVRLVTRKVRELLTFDIFTFGTQKTENSPIFVWVYLLFAACHSNYWMFHQCAFQASAYRATTNSRHKIVNHYIFNEIRHGKGGLSNIPPTN